jgi:cytochrome P450
VAVRNKTDANLRTEPGKPMDVKEDEVANGAMFAEYIEWRAEHPSDDLMTQLLEAEFEDEHGEVRTLTRQEVLTYTAVVAGAGNETTGRLIGWLAKLLAEHPDQRRAVVEDRSLIPNVIDETLRFEPTGHAVARYVMRDVDYYGTTVPAGSSMLLLVAAANRDPRRYDAPDVYDISRDDIQHLTFGYGLHYCLGANLARLEGRVALDELLNRWPEWDVDYDEMELAPTSTVRGWARMPMIVR